MPPSSTSSSPRNRHDRRAFTLTELLIVIVLIIIILGIAIPTLSVLTGSRSTESAKNQFAAMLGRARGLAISNQATIGVAIYVDPVNGQTDMALVRLIALNGPTAYQAWTYNTGAGTPPYPLLGPGAAGGVQYQPGDVVFRLSNAWSGKTATQNPFLETGRKTVKTFVCGSSHIASTANEPGTTGGDNTADLTHPYWRWMPPNSIDLYQGDIEQLPRGVSVELINDSASTAAAAPWGNVDQYVHTGAVLFDSTGKLTVSSISIVPGSSLYNRIVSSSWPGTQLYIPQIPTAIGATQQIFNSSVGVAIYDSTQIADQPFNTSNTATTAADINLPMTSNQQPLPSMQNIKTTQDSWISNNAQLYFVARDSGVLQKAE